MESLLLHSCTRTERFSRAMRRWLWLMRGERIKRRMRCGGTTVRRNRRQGVALVSWQSLLELPGWRLHSQIIGLLNADWCWHSLGCTRTPLLPVWILSESQCMIRGVIGITGITRIMLLEMPEVVSTLIYKKSPACAANKSLDFVIDFINLFGQMVWCWRDTTFLGAGGPQAQVVLKQPSRQQIFFCLKQPQLFEKQLSNTCCKILNINHVVMIWCMWVVFFWSFCRSNVDYPLK